MLKEEKINANVKKNNLRDLELKIVTWSNISCLFISRNHETNIL